MSIAVIIRPSNVVIVAPPPRPRPGGHPGPSALVPQRDFRGYRTRKSEDFCDCPASVAPETLEPIGGEFAVADCVLNFFVTEKVLQSGGYRHPGSLACTWRHGLCGKRPRPPTGTSSVSVISTANDTVTAVRRGLNQAAAALGFSRITRLSGAIRTSCRR